VDPDCAGSRDKPGMTELKKFKISGTNCLDVGSSTGGFTQVLLQYGARHIDAVDVGTDQLHELLRSDTRVTSYEQTDIRDFSQVRHHIYDIIVCDASFISLAMILDAMITLADISTLLILLYKPQFEVGREHLRKTGVPKDPKIVEEKMKEFENLLGEKQMHILQKEKSSLIGEAGNQEWIYMIAKNPEAS
jgi:23S rRNA (cytidine1920-2'-O)/16S rRNA (cytidine1409-2'-O)-methyltransferase